MVTRYSQGLKNFILQLLFPTKLSEATSQTLLRNATPQPFPAKLLNVVLPRPECEFPFLTPEYNHSLGIYIYISFDSLFSSSRLAMDGLSAAASVIAVVQISAEVNSLCQKYLVGVKHARNDIERLSTEVRALREILKRLEELVNSSSVMKLSILAVVNEQGGLMKKCIQQLAGIKDKLEASGDMKKIGLRTLKWPSKSEKIEQIIYDLERYKSAFSMTLNTDQAVAAIAADAGLTQLRRDFAGACIDNCHQRL